ncbi:MAG: hypothetical protein RH862_01590 [Leptospiraceae bacterium]
MRTFPVTLTLLFASMGMLDAEVYQKGPVAIQEESNEIRQLLLDPPEGELSDLKDALNVCCKSPSLALMELADDPTNLARVRILSLALLSEYPGKEVKSYLLSVVRNESAHPTFRGWALQSYARGFAQTESEEVRANIKPYLSDLEPMLRARAETSMEYIVQNRSTGGSDPMKPMISLLLED